MLFDSTILGLLSLFVFISNLVGGADLLKELGKLFRRLGGYAFNVTLEYQKVAGLDEKIDLLKREVVVLPRDSLPVQAIVAAPFGGNAGSQWTGVW